MKTVPVGALKLVWDMMRRETSHRVSGVTKCTFVPDTEPSRAWDSSARVCYQFLLVNNDDVSRTAYRITVAYRRWGATRPRIVWFCVRYELALRQRFVPVQLRPFYTVINNAVGWVVPVSNSLSESDLKELNALRPFSFGNKQV
jgi:hypothetical protein